MSVGHVHGFHFSPSGLPDKQDWLLATQIRRKLWDIRRGYTIPYCAIWDEHERIIYVDELVPEEFEHAGRKLDVIEGPLFWHESLEADICRGYPPEHYQGGHTIATYGAEWVDVSVKGWSIDVYNKLWEPIIKACAARKSFPRVPRGGTLLPYYDSGDEKLISKMTFVD